MGQVFPEIFGFLFPVPFHSCPIFLKVACGAFSALQPVGRLYPCPNEFSSFSSRGATHHIGTRDLFQRRRELYKEFYQHIVIHGGARFFYMPQSWDMGEILSLPLRRKACGGFFRCPKNRTFSAGFEPANSGTRGQHANHQTTEAVTVVPYSHFFHLPPTLYELRS